MKSFWSVILTISVAFLLFVQLPACGDDDGGSATAEQACEHYCSCSFASNIPNCQSTCLSGIQAASDPSACASCTAGASCGEIEADACATACSY